MGGELDIVKGTVEENGIVDFTGKLDTGKVEVFGYSGGTVPVGSDPDAYGLFVASSGSTIKPPAGVRMAFVELTGGETASLQGGKGFSTSPIRPSTS